ncbi:hypothetical protein MANES_02G128500v8 [Manihot esculenta]|uniref:Uncharacterized protein n=1 Tax=Manihot esculenta TaxID=3983 RepID=A0ACB7I705_MANES|nr:hypothetical protein MANES_02G128500v8 [Manihot esculenta]
METEQSNQENPDNMNTEEQGSSQVRSYECNFCKRGFSNAQALGGHMNIHRKDKAKLKHPSSNDLQQSPDIPKILSSSFSSPIPTSMIHPLMQPKSGQDASSIKSPFLDKESDDASKRNGEIQQLLSLFVDKPSTKDHHQQQPNSGQVRSSTEKGFSTSQGLLSSEVDLELRLGPEPQDSLPATSTKRNSGMVSCWDCENKLLKNDVKPSRTL